MERDRELGARRLSTWGAEMRRGVGGLGVAVLAGAGGAGAQAAPAPTPGCARSAPALGGSRGGGGGERGGAGEPRGWKTPPIDEAPTSKPFSATIPVSVHV